MPTTKGRRSMNTQYNMNVFCAYIYLRINTHNSIVMTYSVGHEKLNVMSYDNGIV
jgi:ferritin